MNSFQAHLSPISDIRQSQFLNKKELVATRSGTEIKIWNTFNSPWSLIRTCNISYFYQPLFEWITADSFAVGGP